MLFTGNEAKVFIGEPGESADTELIRIVSGVSWKENKTVNELPIVGSEIVEQVTTKGTLDITLVLLFDEQLDTVPDLLAKCHLNQDIAIKVITNSNNAIVLDGDACIKDVDMPNDDGGQTIKKATFVFGANERYGRSFRYEKQNVVNGQIVSNKTSTQKVSTQKIDPLSSAGTASA